MPFHLSETLLLGFLLAMNLLSFCLMGLDKRRAVKGQWRISERALLLFGFFGGSLGGLLGMFLFRHKTKHRKFTVLMPLFLAFHIALLCCACRLWLGAFRAEYHKPVRSQARRRSRHAVEPAFHPVSWSSLTFVTDKG